MRRTSPTALILACAVATLWGAPAAFAQAPTRDVYVDPGAAVSASYRSAATVPVHLTIECRPISISGTYVKAFDRDITPTARATPLPLTPNQDCQTGCVTSTCAYRAYATFGRGKGQKAAAYSDIRTDGPSSTTSFYPELSSPEAALQVTITGRKRP